MSEAEKSLHARCEELGALCNCPRCEREYGADEYEWCSNCATFEADLGSPLCARCAGAVR